MRQNPRGARRPATGWPSAGRSRSSLSVLAPGLVLLLLLVAAGARVVEVQGHIDGAARDAARAASVARSYGQAVAAAQQAAQADLGTTSLCAPGTVAVQVAGYPAVPLSPPLAAVTVTVTVTCQVDMNPFTALGFGVTKGFTGQAVAPLDPFMCRDVFAVLSGRRAGARRGERGLSRCSPRCSRSR